MKTTPGFAQAGKDPLPKPLIDPHLLQQALHLSEKQRKAEGPNHWVAGQLASIVAGQPTNTGMIWPRPLQRVS